MNNSNVDLVKNYLNEPKYKKYICHVKKVQMQKNLMQ
jgi:hypothetical protein